MKKAIAEIEVGEIVRLNNLDDGEQCIAVLTEGNGELYMAYRGEIAEYDGDIDDLPYVETTYQEAASCDISL